MDSLAKDPKNVQHVPVLMHEVLDGLQLSVDAVVIDATVGGGGHTSAILEQIGPQGRVLGIDADPAAIRRVSIKLTREIEQGRLILHQDPFENIIQAASTHGFNRVDGILFDFGLSSFQLETAERGFSFQQHGPLDMRFDPTQTLDAYEIVNKWSEEALADVLYIYGEEKRSRQIARQIVKNREIKTTDALATIVEKAVGSHKQRNYSQKNRSKKNQGNRGQSRYKTKIHPATRTFQALRIAVNRELAQIETVLPHCLSLLKPEGRLAVISFHSLEDRIVKQWMRKEAETYVHDPTIIVGGYERQPNIKLITRKPIKPTNAEIERNPRSRSAKLRVAEKFVPLSLSEKKNLRKNLR